MSDLKRALLEGTQYLEPVGLKKPNGETAEVQVRPLNSREAAEVEALSKAGLQGPVNEQGKMQVNVDVGQFQNQQWKADVRAVAYGLSHGDDKWTEDEVTQLLPMWVSQLAAVVRRISGIPTAGVSFRLLREGDGGPGGDGGDGDAGAGSGRDSAGEGAS